MTSRHASRGFTTLELLVALAILSLGLMALIDFRMSLLQTQARQLAQVEAIGHESNALAVLRHINPAQTPAGRVTLDTSTQLQWTARLIGGYRPELAWLGRETGYRVARFKVDYAVAQAGTILVRGSVDLIGRTDPEGQPAAFNTAAINR